MADKSLNFHQFYFSHFVPLCRVDDTSAPVIPVHCQPPLYRCTKEIARKYINYNADLSFTIGVPVPCCDIESTHLLKTMGCRYKPHKLSQPGFFHGLIDKLTTSACAELSSENVLGNLLSSCSLSGEKKIDFTLVKGMISVDLLIKVECISFVTHIILLSFIMFYHQSLITFFPFFLPIFSRLSLLLWSLCLPRISIFAPFSIGNLSSPSPSAYSLLI